jgi:hypothetical protein
MSTLGFVGGMYLLIKDALRENAAPKDASTEKESAKDHHP